MLIKITDVVPSAVPLSYKNFFKSLLRTWVLQNVTIKSPIWYTNHILFFDTISTCLTYTKIFLSLFLTIVRSNVYKVLWKIKEITI